MDGEAVRRRLLGWRDDERERVSRRRGRRAAGSPGQRGTSAAWIVQPRGHVPIDGCHHTDRRDVDGSRTLKSSLL